LKNFGDFPTDNGQGKGCPLESGQIDGVCYSNPVTVNGLYYENLGCFCDNYPHDIPRVRDIPKVWAPSKLDVSFTLITRGKPSKNLNY